MDMPRLADAELRAMIAAEDRSQLQLEQSPWNRTGFVGVIQVGGKYYSRLQVAGDGRGGVKKRRQVSLPGPWDTAEDAAVVRAVMIRGFKESGDGKIHSPPKQNKPHKPRAVKRSEPAAAQPAFRASADANGYCHGGAPCSHDATCTHRVCNAAPDAALVVCAAHVSAYVSYMCC